MTSSTRAFTLIELLVSVAIGMMVMGLAVSAYQHSQKLIQRSEALVRLHRTAGDIAEQWEQDTTALMQHVACNGTTSYDGSVKSLVQFTGMITVREVFDGAYYDLPYDTDLAWLRWEWKAADRRLTRARSLPPHWIPWYPKEFLAYVDQAGVPMKPVIGMRPNPVKTYAEFLNSEKIWYDPMQADPSVPRRTRIYDRLFLTGLDSDGVTRGYGGFSSEMNKNAADKTPNNLLNGTYLSAANWANVPVPDPRRTLAEDVTDLSISVVTRGASLISDAGSGYNTSIDGQPQDGMGAIRAARPAMMRLSFTLTDRLSGVTQSFSFSAKAP